MRIRCFFLVAAISVVSAFQAGAADNRDLQECNQRTDYDRQISGCSRALSWLKPANERARIHTLRGMAWTNKEEFNRAIDDYDQAIRLDPGYPWSWVNRAEAWYRKGEAGRAFADLEAAVRLDPGNSRVYSVRASTWWLIGELDRAIADYSEAIRLEPAFSVFYNNRALVWRDKGDYDKALADFDEAIRRDPNDVRAYANRGEIWRLKGDLDRALADQEKQIRISPRNANSYLMRGHTFRYRGEFERALADFDKTLVFELDSIPAYTGRGLTFERMATRNGRAPSSKRRWRREARTVPTSPNTALQRPGRGWRRLIQARSSLSFPPHRQKLHLPIRSRRRPRWFPRSRRSRPIGAAAASPW
jgi:tetratricopeptide (TPR) repeat protein